jgi:hypothetical protein
MSGDAEAGGWSEGLDADLGLSAGLDLAQVLGFESTDDEDDSPLEVDLDSALTIGLDGGFGLAVGLGAESAFELLDVGEDLDESE